ncbi:MAG: DUF4476 domain-containing protein [Niabella sp.]
MNRHLLLSALFLLSAFISFGQGYQVQSKYFVYLQTEPAQPFYIKINGQKIIANASGYLILPQLKDGDYKLVVGFPENKAAEQVFNFKIDSKDKGYLIKDYGADGWGLFDLQSMAVQKAIAGGNTETAAAKAPPPRAEEKKEPVAAEGVTDFTKVLSQAANDPSLLEKPKEQPVEEAPAAAVNNNQQLVINQQPQKQVQQQQAPPQQETVAQQPSSDNNVISSAQTGGGVSLVYDDRNESGQVDPITIFIPEPKKKQKTETPPIEQKNEVINEQEAPDNTNRQKDSEKAQAESGFKVTEKAPIPQHDEEENKKKIKNAVVQSSGDCKSVANDDDFLNLRRTMAGKSNDDDMIAEAQKAFKSKCYSTAQIKYLSSMFLSNAGKYNFYQAAYQHVSDKENFASLGSEIKDTFYQDKFNTLIGQ